MNNYQKALIEEHSQLFARISVLHDYIYEEYPSKERHGVADDDRVEFANKCIQLSSMKKYEEALHARLNNCGIVFENGEYFEKVAVIEFPTTEDKSGSDFDVDSESKDCPSND